MSRWSSALNISDINLEQLDPTNRSQINSVVLLGPRVRLLWFWSENENESPGCSVQTVWDTPITCGISVSLRLFFFSSLLGFFQIFLPPKVWVQVFTGLKSFLDAFGVLLSSLCLRRDILNPMVLSSDEVCVSVGVNPSFTDDYIKCAFIIGYKHKNTNYSFNSAICSNSNFATNTFNDRVFSVIFNHNKCIKTSRNPKMIDKTLLDGVKQERHFLARSTVSCTSNRTKRL